MPRFAWSKSGFDILQNIDIVSIKNTDYILQSSKASTRLSYRGHEALFFFRSGLKPAALSRTKTRFFALRTPGKGQDLVDTYHISADDASAPSLCWFLFKVGDSVSHVSPYHPSWSQFMTWDTMWIMKRGKWAPWFMNISRAFSFGYDV